MSQQVVINFNFPKEVADANWEKLFLDASKPDDFDSADRVAVNYTLDAGELPPILDGLKQVSKRLNAIMSAAQSSTDVKVGVNEDGLIQLIALLNAITLEASLTARHLLNCLFKARNP